MSKAKNSLLGCAAAVQKLLVIAESLLTLSIQLSLLFGCSGFPCLLLLFGSTHGISLLVCHLLPLRRCVYTELLAAKLEQCRLPLRNRRRIIGNGQGCGSS
jgi:hypothetical protein